MLLQHFQAIEDMNNIISTKFRPFFAISHFILSLGLSSEFLKKEENLAVKQIKQIATQAAQRGPKRGILECFSTLVLQYFKQVHSPTWVASHVCPRGHYQLIFSRFGYRLVSWKTTGVSTESAFELFLSLKLQQTFQLV